jgi:predicted aminopeptidase
MKSRFRLAIGIFLFLLTLVAVIKWDLIRYGWMQAKGQWEVISKAEPIENFLGDEQVPDSIKYKLHLINDIKNYAATYLDMPIEGQYNTMYDQKGKDILWVVTASMPHQLKPYQWSFPFLGTVEYKGFFIESEAEKLKNKLQTQGYDVRVRNAAAWSTLGILNDPILSKMLEYSEGSLAELIIHELTHDVVFIKDSVNFNENLATFIGIKGADGFLKHHFSNDSSYLKSYKKRLADKEQLNSFIRNWLPRFKRAYQEIRYYSTVEKEQIKYETFQNFKSELKEVQFTNSKYANFIIDDDEFNNANLLAFRRYTGDLLKLQQEFEEVHHSDVKKMLKYYRENF